MENTYEYNKFIKAREKLYKLRNGKYKRISFNVLISESYKNTPFGKLWLKLQKMSKDTNMAPKELRKAKRIITFDYNSKFSPKNMGIGFKNDYYHTVYGMKVHMSCYEVMYNTMVSGVDGVKRKRSLQSVYDSHRQDMFHKIDSMENILDLQLSTSIRQMNNCGTNYPSIQKYISKWIDNLKQTILFCNENAVADTSIYGSSDDRYKAVMLSPDKFLALMNKQTTIDLENPDGRDTLIHEILHVSHLDNNELGVHNGHLQTVAPHCTGSDRLRDRIYYIAHLCSGTKVNPISSVLNPNQIKLAMDELLARRIKQCGMKDGCVDQFSLNEGSAPDVKAAQRFCSNMNEMGKCKMEVKKMLGKNMPSSVNAIHEKLVDNIISFVSKCDQLFVDASVRDLCPGYEDFLRHSREIYFKISSHHPNIPRQNVIDFLKNEEKIKSLYSISFVRTFLKQDEWKKILNYYKQYSDVTLTNYCGEKLKLTKQLGKMERLSPAPREMRVCPK